jgi:hypothetical protein
MVAYAPDTNSISLSCVKNGDGAIISFFNDPIGSITTAVGSINITATGTTYDTASDYRLKDNAIPMTGSWSKVKSLKPVNYTWKVNGDQGEGFIAHELQEVVPSAVTGQKDAIDSDGNPKYQSIDYSRIVPILTAALQEALARIEALEAK